MTGKDPAIYIAWLIAFIEHINKCTTADPQPYQCVASLNLKRLPRALEDTKSDPERF